MTSESLLRLRHFSQHPTIKVGIKTVRVNLSYYSHHLAESLQSFARYHSDLLTEHIEPEVMGNRPNNPGYLALIDKASQVAASWDKIGNGQDPEDDMGFYIQKSFNGYRGLFEDQQMARDDRRFLQVVAPAYAQFPNAKNLEIHDHVNHGPLGYRYFDADVDIGTEAFRKRKLSPSAWEEAKCFESLATPPVFDFILLVS